MVPGKGVAFVTYDTWATAHRALQATDMQTCLQGCNGVGLSVSFAERTSNVGRGGGAAYSKGLEHTRIIVGGLPETLTVADLRKLFESFGQVTEAELLPPEGEFCCGFVTFSIWGEALDAMELLDGQVFPGTNGEPMSVSFVSGDVPAENRDPSEMPMAKKPRLDSSALALPSPEFDSLKQAYLIAVERETPREVCNELHRKIMATRPAAQKRSRLNSGGFGGTAGSNGAGFLAQQSYAQDQSEGDARLGSGSGGVEDRDYARLFVGGLPYECTAEELNGLIEQVQFSCDPSMSQLLECRVLPNRGCGYIRFASWEAAQECIQTLNERSVTGWQWPLRVRWATPKSELHGTGGGGAWQQDPAVDAGSNAVSSALQALLGGDPGKAVAQLTGGSMNIGASSNIAGAGGDEAYISGQGLDPTRLFVGQLTREFSDQNALQNLFDQFGQIEGIRWLQDKGVAYIKYTDFNGARAAVANLDGKHIQGISTLQGLNVQFSKVR
eukprot:TRINITY_DN2835_c0_g2_i1.p1 TRINITY_DN2835_c0_g2~~TRINITY_DN2835_c0_g2_i1.p1  ORF type:complete len:570 (+),score=91.31 TRINITY_DN2835_c0_g2_i1:219-1712(+)